MKSVYIAAYARTAMGSFGGSLSSFSATKLGTLALKACIERSKIPVEQIEELYFGNVISANLGQAPARQVALGARLLASTNCTTVNKVCASGMKSIMLAAQSIQLGLADVVVAGGMESMSNAPYYVPGLRWGLKYGAGEVVDGLQKDGLLDAYDQSTMGICADQTAKQYEISRNAQDEYTIRSYTLSAEHSKNGNLAKEIVPINIPQKKGDDLIIAEDEEYKKVDFSKIPGLKPSFSADGTVTAASSSTMNDGGSAMILVSEEKLKELNLTPIAKIISYADAEQEPKLFTTSPTLCAPLALKRANMSLQQMDAIEINEAFAVVPLAFSKILNADPNKINIHGGAISIGHPLGMSGNRIVGALIYILADTNKKYGIANICNGGGGASSMVIERI